MTAKTTEGGVPLETQKGEWQDPAARRDREYTRKMQEFFAPEAPPKKAAAPQAPAPEAPAAQAAGKEAATKRLGLVFVAVGAVMALVLGWWVYSTFSGGLFGGGAEEAQAPDGSAPQASAAATAGAEPLTPEETNIVFEKPREPEGGQGAYSLKVGQYTWSGEKSVDGKVEQVVLEGRTAAHFTTAVRLTQGEITTGVFGRAEPGQPLWHATFQRTTSGGREHTMGTYQAVDAGQVILQGAYTDRVVQDNPEDEPDVVVREYVEADPREENPTPERYAVTFRAPSGTPIPWLVGWTPPDPVEDDA